MVVNFEHIINECLNENKRIKKKVLTEDSRWNRIRNIILNYISTQTGMPIDSEQVKELTQQVWDNFVEHPEASVNHHRQNNEIGPIRDIIPRLLPYALKKNADGNFYIDNGHRLRDSFERLLKAKVRNTNFIGDDEDLYSWRDNERYNELLSKRKQENGNNVIPDFHYSVYKVDDYDTPIKGLGCTLKEIGSFTGGNGSSPLCYTASKGTYNSYTHNGKYTMYILLRDGWQNEQIKPSEGYPYDSYGLSMIFIIVSDNGNLETSNVRWNHGDNSYYDVDKMFNFGSLEKVVGSKCINAVGLEDSTSDIAKMKTIISINRKLKEGEDIEVIFDRVDMPNEGIAEVQIYELGWNYLVINERRLLCDEWFENAFPFQSGIGRVAIKDTNSHIIKFNFVNRSGNLISETNFFNAKDFSEGFATVCIEPQGMNRWTVIDKNGRVIMEQQYSAIDKFHNGFAVVEIYAGHSGSGPINYYNYIDRNGKLLCKNHYAIAYEFTSAGYGLVKTNKNSNYKTLIDSEGNKLFENEIVNILDKENYILIYFDNVRKISLFPNHVFGLPCKIVQTADCNLLNVQGVRLENGKCGYFSFETGKLLGEKTFSTVTRFDRDVRLAIVGLQSGNRILRTLINREGEFITDKLYKQIVFDNEYSLNGTVIFAQRNDGSICEIRKDGTEREISEQAMHYVKEVYQYIFFRDKMY